MENILELQQVSKTFPKSNFTLAHVAGAHRRYRDGCDAGRRRGAVPHSRPGGNAAASGGRHGAPRLNLMA